MAQALNKALKAAGRPPVEAPPTPFEAMTALPALYAAWERVRANNGAAGGDGMTIATFSANLGDRLLQLHRVLRTGHYMPGSLRAVDIPKPDGGTRRLAIPSVTDRVAQTAAATILGPFLEGEMHDASFAYRKGRGVHQAVARVAAYRRHGYGWVVDGDISAFFDSIPHDKLLVRLMRSIDDPLVIDLFRRWLDSFSENGTGIAQGAPISPLLANLYLTDIDRAIDRSDCRLVRFADDFVLLCKSAEAAQSALTHIGALLDAGGLRLHAGKTRIVPFDKAFSFLGKLFVRSLVLGDPTRKPKSRGRTPAAPGAATAGEEEEEIARGAPGLRVLYLVRPGRRLSLRNRALTVLDPFGANGGREVLALPPGTLDRIELWPGTEADTLALRHALDCGIEVSYVDARGETLGRMARDPARHAALHLDQARHALDPDLRLALARILVKGRLRNQAVLLKRLDRERGAALLADSAEQIMRIGRRLPRCGELPQLMGLEGAASALFWPAWGHCLREGWNFTVRRRRPPPDPVNALLSMVGGLLYRDIGALVARHGLHPGIGALHTARDDQPALVSDLIEEFRAPLVESFVLTLLNTKKLAPEHFVTGADGSPRLVPEGYARVIASYDKWLNRPIKSGRTGFRVKWRRLVEEQVVAFKAHLAGGPAYAPYAMDY